MAVGGEDAKTPLKQTQKAYHRTGQHGGIHPTKSAISNEVFLYKLLSSSQERHPLSGSGLLAIGPIRAAKSLFSSPSSLFFLADFSSAAETAREGTCLKMTLSRSQSGCGWTWAQQKATKPSRLSTKRPSKPPRWIFHR